MCGIIGAVGTRPDAPEIVVNGLRSLEYRGYDSWGIALRVNGVTTVEKQIGKMEESAPLLETLAATKAYLALGHTRWATHGGKTVPNAHPHQSESGRITLVHNGIIENYQELKEALGSPKLKSQTDTEVLAYLIGRKREVAPNLREAVREALKEIKGSYAIVVMEDGSDELVGARQGSPLVVGLADDQMYLASDVPAFLHRTKRVVFLEDGDLVQVQDGKASVFSIRTGKAKRLKVTTVAWDAEQAKKGDYPHFMIKEIHEQPRAIRSAIAHSRQRIEAIAATVRDAYGVFFVACGSAYHAGLTGTYLFSSLAKRHVNITVASEFPSYRDFLTDRTLLIPISQSGETADTLEAVRAAKRKGSQILSVVNVQGSTLVRESDDAILTQAGPEIGVASTKALTSQIALVTLLSYTIAGRYDEGRKLVEQVADAIEEFLTGEAPKQLQALAHNFSQGDHLFAIGRALNYPTALEAALKIKEVSYVHAEGIAGGELKHGPIALIEHGTPVLVFVANDEVRAEILANAMELKSRGAVIVGISPMNNEIFDHWIRVADLPTAMPLVGAVPAQLLAYYMALERGTDPDKPRNLAKSVTVK